MDSAAFRGLVARLRAPLVVAPMWGVSTLELVVAAIAGGVVGGFPTSNAPSVGALDDWLGASAEAAASAGPAAGVAAPNLVLRGNRRLDKDIECLTRHRVTVVITSVGSPAPVIEPLHQAGTFVLADVATARHADQALEAGADGLVLLSAGAGGQTGWANPFAFVRSMRSRSLVPLVLAGGIGDGIALRAAIALGCDLGYMGTRFLATAESGASKAHKQSVVAAGLDDIGLATSPMGLPTNYVTSSVPAGHPRTAGAGWHSAGHSASSVEAVVRAASLIERIANEFHGVAWPARDRDKDQREQTDTD